jgi:hypothetical protein
VRVYTIALIAAPSRAQRQVFPPGYGPSSAAGIDRDAVRPAVGVRTGGDDRGVEEVSAEPVAEPA